MSECDAFPALLTTVSFLREIPTAARKPHVTAWLNRHTSAPGEAAVRVTPWHCDYIGTPQPTRIELTISPLEVAQLNAEFDRTVPNEADMRALRCDLADEAEQQEIEEKKQSERDTL
jgi:hypothetical protein